jgi:UDP-3-O-[3-hydroxymyristoyl] glucosamine N-acyltransferase
MPEDMGMVARSFKLNELADTARARVEGDGSVEIRRVASLESAGEGDLVFVEDPRRLEQAIASRAAAVVAGEFAVGERLRKPLLVARQPKLAFARVAAAMEKATPPPIGVHPSAVVHPSAKLGADVTIGPHAVIGASCAIGERTVIGAGVVIGDGVRLGASCTIHPRVVMYSGTTLGSRVIVHAGTVLGADGFGYVRDGETGRQEKFPQIGRLEIGDDVEIGANVTIDRGALDATVIGRGVKIDNLVQVGHNVRIGDDVVIAAQTGISGSSVIGRQVMLAGQVGIADHVRLGDGVIVGAQSGVAPHKILEGPGQPFFGSPARPLKQHLKEMAAVARLARERASNDKDG